MSIERDVGRQSGVIRRIDFEAGTMVEAEWMDSERVTLGWATVDDYNRALTDRTTYRTCGYLMASTADYALIALNRSDSGLVGEAMVIPLACILSIARLVKA
jgi:hypothetical protein